MVFGYFDRAYLINVDADTDRLSRCQRRLKSQAIRYERFSGLTPPQPRIGQALPNGYIGCAMSHMSIVRMAKTNGLRNVLVFEDDCVFRDDMAEIMWQHIVPEIQTVSWDILYLGAEIYGKVRAVTNHLSEHQDGYQNHAYAVNASAFDAVEKACLQTIHHRACSQDVSLTRMGSLRKLHTVPILVIQEEGYSRDEGKDITRYEAYAQYFDFEDFVTHCGEMAELLRYFPQSGQNP